MIPLRWVIGALLAVAVTTGIGGAAYYKLRRPSAQAEQLLDAGKPRDALLELRQVTRNNPKDGDAFLLLGKVHAQLGDIEAAERDLKRARALGADRREVLSRLGQFYLGARRFRDVIAEIPATGPDRETTALYLAMRSRAYTGLNETKAAAQALDAARKASPDNAEVAIAAARLAVGNQDVAAATASIDAALVKDPANLEALTLKTQLVNAKGDAKGALAFADRAVDVAPAYPAPRLARANLYLALGEDAKAQADVNAVLASQPRNAPAIYLDAVLDIRAARFTEAATRLQDLGPSAARFPRASYFEAVAALGTQLPATAVEAAGRYVGQNPADPDGVRLLARAQTANRRPDLAAVTLSEAVRRGIDDAQTLDGLGDAWAAIGNVGAAEGAYRMALAKAPDEPLIKIHLADLKTRQGDGEQAATSLEQAGPGVVDQPEAMQALIRAQISAGENAKAAATLDRLRAKTGETEPVGILTGILAMARRDTDQAIAAFSATAKAFPGSTTATINLARALAAAGRRDEARIRLAELLAKDPANPQALTSLVQIDVDASRFATAIRALEAARTAAPADDGIVAMLSDTLTRSGQAATAIDLIGRARPGKLPGVVSAALARAQVAAGRPNDAELTYADALATAPDTQAALGLAALQQERNDGTQAKATLDREITRTPGSFELLTRRIQLEADSAGIDAALRLAATLRQNPASMPTAAVLAGDALMRANRPSDAAAVFRTEWAATPSTALALRLAEAQIAAGSDDAAIPVLQTIAQDPGAALLMSQIDIRAKRWPNAVQNLELALRGRPNDPGLMNNLAWAYQVTADARALPTAQRAYLIEPSPETMDTLGWIMVQQGTPEKGLPILQQAAKARPDNPELAYHVAVALDRTGQPKAAAALLKTLLALGKPFEERPNALELSRKLGQP